MKIIKTIDEWKTIRNSAEFENKSLGFVPTMGTLHQGHLSLIEESKKQTDVTLVSIFVNPTQFNDKNDFASYPKTYDADIKALEELEVDYLLYPEYDTLYPDNYNYMVSEKELSKLLCGASRPGHFDGVLTVVLKLFNIANADKAFFGEKDYQQMTLIKKMTEAFFIDTEVVSCPTIRESDGLAMSSRNLLLSKEERSIAPSLYKELTSGKTITDIKYALSQLGFKVDYIEEIKNRIYAAAYLGNVRLIDNVEKK